MSESSTAIYLSDDEAEEFLRYQKYGYIFSRLDKEGMIGHANSSIELNFDKNGRLGDIHFKRRVTNVFA